MALPDTFTSIRKDEQGRDYVVHKPTGVWRYVRDSTPAQKRNCVLRTYTPDYKRGDPPQQKSLEWATHRAELRQALDEAAKPPRSKQQSTIAALIPQRRRNKPEQSTIIRARFIPGSEPRE